MDRSGIVVGVVGRAVVRRYEVLQRFDDVHLGRAFQRDLQQIRVGHGARSPIDVTDEIAGPTNRKKNKRKKRRKRVWAYKAVGDKRLPRADVQEATAGGRRVTGKPVSNRTRSMTIFNRATAKPVGRSHAAAAMTNGEK